MNPISIALAIPFVGSVRAILRRSTNVSPRAAHQNRYGQSAPNGHRIIVPIMESAVSMQAVEVACQLASEQQATIMLACVVSPRDA
jgi:hypothetical protein